MFSSQLYLPFQLFTKPSRWFSFWVIITSLDSTVARAQVKRLRIKITPPRIIGERHGWIDMQGRCYVYEGWDELWLSRGHVSLPQLRRFTSQRRSVFFWWRLMSHFYRICDEQITEVVKGLRLRLMLLLEERKDLEATTHALHALHRLTHRQQSSPTYPKPTTLNLIEKYLRTKTFLIKYEVF